MGRSTCTPSMSLSPFYQRGVSTPQRRVYSTRALTGTVLTRWGHTLPYCSSVCRKALWVSVGLVQLLRPTLSGHSETIFLRHKREPRHNYTTHVEKQCQQILMNVNCLMQLDPLDPPSLPLLPPPPSSSSSSSVSSVSSVCVCVCLSVCLSVCVETRHYRKGVWEGEERKLSSDVTGSSGASKGS